MRINSVMMLAPSMERDIADLMDWLNLNDAETEWMIFETYRSPADQYQNLIKGTSKSKPMLSAHQHGLAADIVPFVNGKPAWPASTDPCWTRLKAGAKAVGSIEVPIKWDSCHVQCLAWPDVIAVLR